LKLVSLYMNKFYFILQLDDDRENAFLNLKKFLEDHPIPIVLKPDDSIKRYVEGKENLKKM